MIHLTRSRRAEIVLFGREQKLVAPFVIEAGTHIMVTARASGEVTVAKFSVNESDQKRVVSTRVEEVIRAIVDLGGTYPDVVQALEQAKAAGALASRFEVDALPEVGRPYDRNATQSAGPPAQAVRDAATADEKPEKNDEKSADSTEKTGSEKGFFARITGK
jgi:hypothetical protein